MVVRGDHLDLETGEVEYGAVISIFFGEDMKFKRLSLDGDMAVKGFSISGDE